MGSQANRYSISTASGTSPKRKMRQCNHNVEAHAAAHSPLAFRRAQVRLGLIALGMAAASGAPEVCARSVAATVVPEEHHRGDEPGVA